MLEPKEIQIEGKTYIITKFTATAGREITIKYISSGLPKIGEYSANEEIMFKLMSHVYVKIENGHLALSNRELIDNHVKNWEVGIKIEAAMMEYNCSFFRDGRISHFFDDFAQKVRAWTLKTWTDLSERLLQAAKPPSTN